MSCKNAIEIRNLSKRYEIYRHPYHRLFQTLTRGRKTFYKEFYALHDLSLDIRKGECVGIIGRNGAGKSTLLQIIAETLRPTSGTLTVNGKLAALLELGSGFNPEFTGIENIFMYGAVLGLSEQQIKEKLPRIIEFADIGEAVEQPVKTYSSGMTMRLAFAVAAHIDAEILIVDEALAVGDVLFVQKCFAFLREFIKEHTVILVTHDIAAVRDLCSRAIWLKDGRLEMDGDPAQVTDAYLAWCYGPDRGGMPLPEAEQEVKTETEAPTEKLLLTDDIRREIWQKHSEARPQYTFFDFDDEASSFGRGGARFLDVAFFDRDGSGEKLRHVGGGEKITLRFTLQALEDLSSPIAGFAFRNHRGENLFGDNTFELYANDPQPVKAGQTFYAEFCFEMPRLPSGEYTLHAAIADGTQDDHVQHQWFHNCLTIVSSYHGKTGVMVGIPMSKIELKTTTSDTGEI